MGRREGEEEGGRERRRWGRRGGGEGRRQRKGKDRRRRERRGGEEGGNATKLDTIVFLYGTLATDFTIKKPLSDVPKVSLYPLCLLEHIPIDMYIYPIPA